MIRVSSFDIMLASSKEISRFWEKSSHKYTHRTPADGNNEGNKKKLKMIPENKQFDIKELIELTGVMWLK